MTKEDRFPYYFLVYKISFIVNDIVIDVMSLLLERINFDSSCQPTTTILFSQTRILLWAKLD